MQVIPKRGAAWAVHMLTLHLLGGLNFDHPQLSVIEVVRRGGFFFNHSNEVVVIKEVGDRDGGAGASSVITVRLGLLFFSSIPSPLPCGLCTFSLIYYMPYPHPYCTTYAHISTC